MSRPLSSALRGATWRRMQPLWGNLPLELVDIIRESVEGFWGRNPGQVPDNTNYRAWLNRRVDFPVLSNNERILTSLDAFRGGRRIGRPPRRPRPFTFRQSKIAYAVDGIPVLRQRLRSYPTNNMRQFEYKPRPKARRYGRFYS